MRLGSLLSRLVFLPCVALLFLAACGDGVTEPTSGTSTEARATKAGTGTPETVTTTTESQCSANPSEGCYIVGTCNTTDAFQSCYEQGGGSYGGGTGGTTGGTSGGTGTGSGGSGSSPAAPSTDDAIPDAGPPDCTKPQTHPALIAYCAGTPAAGAALDATKAALARIRAKGGECANIAAKGEALLATSPPQIRYFPGSGENYNGWGRPDLGVIIDDRMIPRTDHYDLVWLLVHEIEHVMGRAHVAMDANNRDLTPNNLACL